MQNLDIHLLLTNYLRAMLDSKNLADFSYLILIQFQEFLFGQLKKTKKCVI